MPDVEKVARAIPDEAVEAMDRAYMRHESLTADCLRDMLQAAIAAMGEREAKPVAWRYEIADAVIHNPDGTKTGANWRVIVAGIEPCVPGWGIRNLTPLYASPRPEAVEAIRATGEPPAPTPLTPSIPDQR